jgi:hypothetical protein
MSWWRPNGVRTQDVCLWSSTGLFRSAEEIVSLCIVLAFIFEKKCEESDFEKNSQGRIMYHVVIRKRTGVVNFDKL